LTETGSRGHIRYEDSDQEHSRIRAQVAVVALAALTSFSGCINYYYTPGVYEIEVGRVAPLASVGSVEVISIQESDPDRNYIFFEPGPPNGTPIARKSQKPSPHSCPVRSLARADRSGWVAIRW
jgi:hypothetical protein